MKTMSESREVRVPDIGDFDKVPVIEVLVAEGDRIEAEQSLITLESDKATMEVPAPAAGRLIELKVSEGDEVSEGDLIALLEVEGGEGEDQGSRQKAQGKGSGEKGKGSGFRVQGKMIRRSRRHLLTTARKPGLVILISIWWCSERVRGDIRRLSGPPIWA